jgi:uncharacterized damage-inducible protein DinB
MNESERIADQLHRAFHEGAWHGPSVKQALEGVTAGTALAKPIPSAHSVWELVHHLTAWVTEADATVRGKPYESLKDEKDWPPVTEISSQAWEQALARLEQAEASLEESVRFFPPDKLGDGDRSCYYLVHGIVQHNLYHAGQIVLIKKEASRQSENQ